MQEAGASLLEIIKLGISIREQAKQVKANREQCQTLAYRVQTVIKAVQGVEKTARPDRYRAALVDLNETLAECLVYMEKFKNKSRLKQFLFAGSISDRFTEFNQALQQTMVTLGLGVQAKQLLDAEKDRADRAKDHLELKERQAEILTEAKAANERLQELDMKQDERDRILQEQLESMKSQLAQLTEGTGKKVKPLSRLIPSYLTVNFHELGFDSVISKDEFATQYRGQWQQTPVLIKAFEQKMSKHFFEREVQILQRLRHPNIVTFYGASLNGRRRCIILEHAEHGALSDFVQAYELTPEQRQSMILGVARGLHYLHSQDMLHRDFSTSNILVNEHNEVRVTNFCLSKSQAADVKTAGQASQSLAFKAPELWQRDGQASIASDIFSFGCVLWEIVTGQTFMGDVADHEIGQHILDEAYPEIPGNVEPIYARLIKACWSKDPDARPDLSEVILEVSKHVPPQPSPNAEERYAEGLQYERAKQMSDAFRAYERAQQKGHVKAHTNLATFYQHGLGGIQQDPQRAMELLRVAANEGHVRAMFNLGMMLSRGRGIPVNIPEAITWFEQAAAHGDTKAAAKAEQLRDQHGGYEGNLASGLQSSYGQ